MNEMNNRELGTTGIFFSLIPWLSVLGLILFQPR
jgi:hypothetical protein